MNKKVVLAYSGGLDTSVILKWLCNEGYEVICYIANVGQQECFKQLETKALGLGAKKIYLEDLQSEFVKQYMFQAMKANALYEGKYLLGTALARPLIAKKQIEIAKKEHTKTVAHGSTGKGNDQIRFEMAYYSLMPDVQILSPWKLQKFIKQFQGRPDLIKYAQAHGIPIDSSLSKPYSIDENSMHISYEGGPLEDITEQPTNLDFQTTPNQEKKDLSIHFYEGYPTKLVNHTDGVEIEEPVKMVAHLNQLGKKSGIGITDMVESRIIGIKSRGIYSAPAASILYAAHREIEAVTLDREVILLKDMLAPKIAQLIYSGLWFSPEMNFLMAAINQSQLNVHGCIHGTLQYSNFNITGRQATKSLYNKQLASMDTLQDYNVEDVTGFIKINSLRVQKYLE